MEIQKAYSERAWEFLGDLLIYNTPILIGLLNVFFSWEVSPSRGEYMKMIDLARFLLSICCQIMSTPWWKFFSKFLCNFLTFFTNWNIFQKIDIFFYNFSYTLIIKCYKISKIFCKYNFWWNVKKLKRYFLKIMGWENSEYSEFICMKNSERRCKLSEYFWVFLKMFQFV